MSPTSLWSILKALNDRLDRVLSVVCAVLLTIMVVTIFVQVLARYVFLASTPWSEEIAVYCFIWVVFLGTGLGVRDHAHLVADLLPDTMGPFWDKTLMVFSHGMVTVTALVFLWYGLDYAILGMTRLSFSMGFPMFYIYVSLPITGAVMLLFLIERYHALWTGEAER
jgi:TRAP-type C4-dicarboxylate transport system permease small subunit